MAAKISPDLGASSPTGADGFDSNTSDTKTKLNANLAAARKNKNDEFYTRLEDIENELAHYKTHFKGKVVFCNCDDPEWSNFWRYFHAKFDFLGLKRLIATYYAKNGKSAGVLMLHEETRDEDGKPRVLTKLLQGDGDFRSPECRELLEEADIVVTNPPFSLFREFIALLMAERKKFLVIGDMNAITFKEVFPLIRDNLIWLGVHTPKKFRTETDNRDVFRQFGNKCWFTNMTHKRRVDECVPLYKTYAGNEQDYPTFDNFDAINVDKTSDIPMDFDGLMGVPISFLMKYNPNQFEIVGITKTWNKLAIKSYEAQVQVDKDGKTAKVRKLNDGAAIQLQEPPKGKTYYVVDGKVYTQVYPRFLVKRKKK